MIAFECPQCAAMLPVPLPGRGVTCSACNAAYPEEDGILSLLRPDRRRFFESLLSGAGLTVSPGVDESTVLEANLRYHQEHAGEYEDDASTELVFSQEAGRRIGEVIELARLQTAGENWLDVGCGTGHVLAAAAKAFPHAVGMDLSLPMLKLAAAKRLTVIRAEAYRLPLPDESVDVVSAFALLHHLHEPAVFYRQAFRVLRPGGLFYSDSDPNVRPRRHGIPYRLARALYYRAKRLGRQTIDSDPEARRLALLADFQMFYSEDFNGESQAEKLLQLGFAPANVVFHYNAASIYYPSEAPLATHLRALVRTPVSQWFDMRFMADHFLLLASKPRR